MSAMEETAADPASLSPITTLLEGKAYALHSMLKLDGRIGSFPVSARGWSPSNCYLLCDDGGALLLDTGYSAFEKDIIGQIESVIGRDTPLMICPLRINDYMSVCNAMPIAEHFSDVTCLALSRGTAAALDFRSATPEEAARRTAKMPLELFTGHEWVRIGDGREVKFNQSPVRLISTRWVYDPLTKTLFTSDMFAHNWSKNVDEPLILDSKTDTATEKDVRAFLLSTRFWWLDGAKTDRLRRDVAQIFETFDIETLAPGYGKILRGKDVVERNYKMLDNVLRSLDVSVNPARYVARNESHYS